MKIRSLLASTMVTGATLLPIFASASSVTGTVIYVSVRKSDGLISVGINPGHSTTRPSCANGDPYVIADETSSTGQKQYSMLLAALLSGTQVTITGTDLCGRTGTPGNEDISEVTIGP